MERKQKKAIINDLRKKMVFLSGPRQAGKTTLAKQVAKEFSSFVYLTFDHETDKRKILGQDWPEDTELVILDEVHKMKNWKNYLKGVYDTKPKHQKILVTGSARLETFRQVGDSLAGRYFLHRLFPLSPAECQKVGVQFQLDRFLERGGFPEPFLAKTSTDADRWRMQYVDSLLHEDVLNFENIQNLNNIRLLFKLLQGRVGSPTSFSSLAEDMSISPNTVKKYIQILEALYVIFRVTPFSNNIARSLLKDPKIYFFDTGLVKGDAGVVFENLVALSLLKHVHAKIDSLGKPYSLNYLRTKEKKEVDFAIIQDQSVESMIEVKLSNHSIGPGLRYFHNKYGFPSYQVVKNLKKEFTSEGIQIVHADKFLKNLDL